MYIDYSYTLQLLGQVSRQPLDKDLTVCKKEFNISKNRNLQFVPCQFHILMTKNHANILLHFPLHMHLDDYQRVCLKLTGQPGSDYINASWINVSRLQWLEVYNYRKHHA